MADFDVNPRVFRMRTSAEQCEHDALVHLGFYRNLQATWPDVALTLERALAGKAVDDRDGASQKPLEALYVTGHSLGAAMAALAAVQLATDPVQRERFRSIVRGVYTFGQPMIGDRRFAEACESDALLARRVFRHVHRNDVVPHLPAVPYGRFRHFGREFCARDGLGWRERTDRTEQAPDIVLSMFVVPTIAYWARQLACSRRLMLGGYSWYDHLPQFYIDESMPPGVASELTRQHAEVE
jgi:hypothetical protein